MSRATEVENPVASDRPHERQEPMGMVLATLRHLVRDHDDDAAFSTAELLGNAALGIAALVAIWAMLQALGVNVVTWIGGQLGM